MELEAIASTKPLKKILAILLTFDHQDAAHDLSHLLRVAYWTIKIAQKSYPEKFSAALEEECVAAALLHDLVNLPKNHPERNKASEYSALKAEPILQEAGFSPEAGNRICQAILDHSYSRGHVPSGILGKSLQDADRLEAVGAIGIMRVFATGAKMGTSFFNTQDPWAKKRSLDDKLFSLDHFFTKLLLLPESMNTKAGKEEALRRVEIMNSFLQALGEEMGEMRP